MSGATTLSPPAARPRFRLPLEVVRRGTIPQLPGLDGMRGVAVLLVIVYHLGSTAFPGGFLGVDVFFVVSGYLITSLLLAEMGDKGYLDLAGFWARRLRRLVPALVLLLGTLAIAVPVLASDAAGRLRSDLPASLFYLANWWQIFAHRSYFEAFGRPDLLQHLWSLAIEEQFYLFWPPLLAALYTRLRGRRWIIPCLTASGAGISALLMAQLFDPGRDPSRVYYGTDTRASALLIGATLAFLWNPDVARRPVNLPPVLIDTAGAFGVLLVFIGATQWNGYDPTVYRGGFLLIALATALILVAAATNHTMISAVMRAPALRWIGERSYGLYLWHWPIIQMTRANVDVPLHGTGLLMLRLMLIGGAAEASWQLVERPLRRPRTSSRGPASHRYRRASLVISLALPLLLVPFLAASTTTSTASETGPSDFAPAGASTDNTTAILSATETGVPATTAAPSPIATLPVSTSPPGTTEAPAAATPATPPATTAPPGSLTPASVPAGERGSNILFLGDSVMLGARPQILTRYPAADVDAVVSRQLRDAPALIRTLSSGGRVRPVVVFHLGSNGSATADQLNELLASLHDAQRIVFLTSSAPRPWRDDVNARLSDLAGRDSRVTVLDWREITHDESGLLVNDGVHLTPTGAARYAALIESAIG